jgi:general stress protein 26
MSNHSAEGDVQKLGKLIKGIKVAMLTTLEADGSLHGRPMATQDAPFDGTLWFFTRADAPKAEEIRQRPQVNVSYAAHPDQHYVSVSGTAEVVRDREKMKQFWSPLLRAWFPKGLNDPEIALLRVKAEYWDAPSGTFVLLAGFVKALATGQTYAPGENRKIDLRGGMQ